MLKNDFGQTLKKYYSDLVSIHGLLELEICARRTVSCYHAKFLFNVAHLKFIAI